MRIYFVTANEKKIAESDECLKRFLERAQTQEGDGLEIEICPFKKHLDELLDTNIERIVRNKAIEAYRAVRLPCVVEHGGLFLDAWGGSKTDTDACAEPKGGLFLDAWGGSKGLLGGLGQEVWKVVGHRMCGFLRADEKRDAEAQSIIGYCDGRRVRIYTGITKGEVTHHARGDRGIRWDPIFKPADCDLTYGEMAPEEKCETSPEEKAWELFFRALEADSLQARRK